MKSLEESTRLGVFSRTLIGLPIPWVRVLVALAFVVGPSRAVAQNVLTNGSFESGGGSFAGWTVVNQAAGSGNWFIQTGTLDPQPISFTVPAPPNGTFAAMTGQTGPGAHVLYQDFTVPASVTAANLSFMRFRGNRGGPWVSPATLDYTVNPNQQCRVDIITTTAAVSSVLPADVLLNLFQSNPGDIMVDPAYVLQNNNLTAFLAGQTGMTLRLRFAETDNTGFFQLGIDDVILTITGGGGPSPPPTGDEGSFEESAGPTGGTEGSFGYGGFLMAGPGSRSRALLGPFGLYLGVQFYAEGPGVHQGVINRSHRLNVPVQGTTACASVADQPGSSGFVLTAVTLLGLLALLVACMRISSDSVPRPSP